VLVTDNATVEPALRWTVDAAISYTTAAGMGLSSQDLTLTNKVAAAWVTDAPVKFIKRTMIWSLVVVYALPIPTPTVMFASTWTWILSVDLTPGQLKVTSVVVVAKVVLGSVNWQIVCANTLPREMVVFDMMIP
jgi:hypothetical protein